jgi:GT2 family glycosyltransferase
VVVPFAGPRGDLEEVLTRMARLSLLEGDTLTVVDNGPAGETPADPRVLPAREHRSSYYARNRGAGRGGAEWILFLDADVDPPEDLLERYFEQPPGERTAVVAGGIFDEPDERSRAARYAHLVGRMAQPNTLRAGEWAYAQTANCAMRRAAFEGVGGFRDELRSAGDADLCFRLTRAGWAIAQRPAAAVVHRSRRTLRSLLRQRARHGSGAAWLDREYPGSFPRKNPLGLAKWTLQSFARAVYVGARGRSDDALIAAINPLDVWAFELGRLFPNTARPRR